MAKREFRAHVAVTFGRLELQLRAFGLVYGQELRAEGEPSASAIDAKIRTIGKQNKGLIAWYPSDYPRNATLFRDAKKDGAEFELFDLYLGVEGYPQNEAKCKGVKLKNVFRDARNGEEIVEFTAKSITVK
jgi:hypothetical protein